MSDPAGAAPAQPCRATQRGPRRRAGGAFYTPEQIAAALTERALRPGGRVLDPACGEGAFLLAAADRLAAHRDRAAVARRLLGLEIDPDAAARARATVARWAGIPLRQVTGIRQGDALLGDDLERLLAEHGAGGGVDLVLGNPPYLSVKRGELAGRAGALRERYRLARGQWDAYMLFVERAFELLSDGGRLAYVLPRPALVNQQAAPMRRLIGELGGVREVIDFGRWRAGAEVETIGLIAERGARPETIRFARFVTGRFEPLTEMPARPPGEALPIGLCAAELERLERLEAAPWRLGAIAEVRRGLEIGKQHAALRGEPTGPPLLRGEDVGPFRAESRGRLTLARLAPAELKQPALFAARPKLLVRRVAARPIAAVDHHGAWCLNTLYVVQPRRPGLDLDWLAALLNSESAAFWFRAACGGDEALFPYLRQNQLLRFPLPRPDRALADLGRRLAERADPDLLAECDRLAAESYERDKG